MRLHGAPDLFGKAQETNKVGDGGAILPDSGGDLLLGQSEFISQALIRQRFVNGVQVLALEVFDQREFEQLLITVRDISHDHGYSL